MNLAFHVPAYGKLEKLKNTFYLLSSVAVWSTKK